MSKDQWISDLERMLEDYSTEHYNAQLAVTEEFVGKLTQHGLDLSEARKMLEEAIS